MDLIEPKDDASPEDCLRDRLLAAGVLPADIEHIYPIALTTTGVRWWPNGRAINPLPEVARVDAFVRLAAEAHVGANSPGIARFAFFTRCCLQGVMADSEGPVLAEDDGRQSDTLAPVVDALLPHFLRTGMDPSIYVSAMPPDQHHLRDCLVAQDALRESVRPAAYLDMTTLRSWDRFQQRSQAEAQRLDRPEYWARVRGAACLGDLLSIVVAEPAGTACRVARAFLQAFGHPCWDLRGPLDDERAAPAIHQGLQPWVEHLASRVQGQPDDIEALGAYFEAVELLSRAGRGAVPEAVRDQASRIADRALGRLRTMARANPQGVDALSRADKHEPQMSWSAALAALARHGGLGKALLSGVQLLRQLAEPAVARDLRWWDEAPLDAPPHRWRWLPMTLVGIVHASGAREEATDPDLLHARETLAGFLFDRLKRSKATNDTSPPVEPNATWRRCCIRAARELGVNPGGTAHRILHHVSQSDPDTDVREAAVTAYDELRRATGDTGDVSPRRRLVAAIWWLRQAHLLALGVDVDAAGARRTRQYEISRTKEKKTEDGITV